jgi:hypothetical protein
MMDRMMVMQLALGKGFKEDSWQGYVDVSQS